MHWVPLADKLEKLQLCSSYHKINVATKGAMKRALLAAAAPPGSAKVMLRRLNDKVVLTQLVITSQQQPFPVRDSSFGSRGAVGKRRLRHATSVGYY